MMMHSSLFRPTIFCRFFATPALRDPTRPSLPLSAYIRFAGAYRKEKSMKGGKESMKLIGAAWKTLSVSQKSPFENAYQGEREKYLVAFKKYKDSGALEDWKRDRFRPKRPQSGFFRFLTSFRASGEAKQLKPTEVVREGAKRWKTMDPVKKKTLNDAYLSDKTKYDRDFAQYKASGKEIAWKKKVGIWDVEQKALMKKEEVKEKKRKLAMKARLVKERVKAKEKVRKLKMKDLQLRQKEKSKFQKERERAKSLKLRQKETTLKAKAKATKSARLLSPGGREKERKRLLSAIAKEKRELDKLSRKLTKTVTKPKAKSKAKPAAKSSARRIA